MVLFDPECSDRPDQFDRKQSPMTSGPGQACGGFMLL